MISHSGPVLIATVALALEIGCGADKPIRPQVALPENGPLSSEQIDTVLAYFADFPNGVQAGIAMVAGDSIFFAGVLRHNDTLRPVDNRDAVFEIGSVTKVFTATLLACLVAEGRVSLDDSLSSCLGFEPHGCPYAGKVITLRSLANHTSGLPSVPSGFMLRARLHFHADDPYWDYDVDRLERYLREDCALDFAPGERYQYSNLGYSVLGEALVRRTGETYEQLLRARILEPLEMHSTTTDGAGVQDRMVPGVCSDGKAAPNWDLHAFAPAGGLKSTAQDMVRFVRAQWSSSDPWFAAAREIGYRINDANSVALGWHARSRPDQGWWFLHPGGTRGYSSLVVVDPASRRGIVVLSNLSSVDSVSDGVQLMCLGLMETLERR